MAGRTYASRVAGAATDLDRVLQTGTTALPIARVGGV